MVKIWGAIHHRPGYPRSGSKARDGEERSEKERAKVSVNKGKVNAWSEEEKTDILLYLADLWPNQYLISEGLTTALLTC